MKLLTKRIACLLLAVAMTVGLLPTSALAARVQNETAETPAGEETASAGLAEQPAEALDARTGDQDPELTIPGYTRVTELPANGLSGKYLIVATYDSNYYMLYPGEEGAGVNKKNSAKLEVGADGAATGYKVNVPSYNDAAAMTDFSVAENTIAKNGERYSVTAGTNYRLCLLSGNAGYRTSGDSALQVTVSNGLFRFIKPENNDAKLIFYAPHMNFNQSGNESDGFPDLMLFQKDIVSPLPGYNQVTSVSQIKADRKYLIVAQKAPGETFYALHINADGTDKNPGQKGHPECSARLAVSGETISATGIDANGAATSTSVDMSDLLVTIAPKDGGYTIQNDDLALWLNTGMFAAKTNATSFTLGFVTDNRFDIFNSYYGNRHLTFNIKDDNLSQFSDLDSGFCGWAQPQPNNIPIYLYIQGDLPIEPGMALSGMLSGDQFGGASTTNPNENPAGQNSWVFTGGRAAQGSYADVAGARTWAGHFEEWVRYTHAKQLQPSGERDTPYFQRHVINAAYTGQTLQNIVDSFDARIKALKPRAVVYLVDVNGRNESDFATNLNSLIDKSLALKDGTGMLVIQTLTQADKDAVDAVVDGLTDAQKPRVLPVLVTLSDAQKTGGTPNAQGHLAMAKALADAVAGTTVSTADRWPFTLTNSNFTEGWPVKTTVTATHNFETPNTSTGPRKTIKDKVANTSTAMTWLFMGDSITHGSAWTGGYDSLAQLFEKFVKDDLGRKQDIVINAGSSGADTLSTVSDLDRRLTKYSPDVVVLMLGTNSHGVDNDGYKANLRTILNAIIAKGAVPVLRTPPPAVRSGYDHVATRTNLIKAVAEESAYADKVIVVDQYTAWTNSNWREAFTTARDNLHPDEAGHLWFAHQLINEMGLWKADSAICNLEYVARVEAEPETAPVIPGYTQLTDMADVDQTKGYLIVSRDAEGNLYALYPSLDSTSIDAASLPSSPTAEDNGARTACLTVDEETVSAKWLKTDEALDMKGLLFGIKAGTGSDSGKYIFTAFNGRHLNMNKKMFTEGESALTVTSRGADQFYGFQISTDQDGGRVLDFSKNGDPNAFQGSGAGWGTDFWAPRSMNMNIWLYQSTIDVPTAKSMLQELLDKANALTSDGYTRASWRALQTAVSNANAAIASGEQNSDAEVYATARDALRDAIDGLQAAVTVPTVPEGATKIEDWTTMRPANGTTQDEPFPTMAGGSKNFRIPAIITLKHQSDSSKNGRLLAAIDARWNHNWDAQDLDTIVSYSDNNGKNWSYHFANYFGDNTNQVEPYSTAFIDPQLTEALDGTIYLMVDLYPGHVAITGGVSQPQYATGYEDIGGTKRLVLYTSTSGQTGENYSYYVGDFASGYAPVMEPMGGEEDLFSGFYVDEYYYLYHTADDFANKTPATDKVYCQRLNADNTYVQQNVFFHNAVLHVRNASYLWIVKSTDGGETWSAPSMINDQVRTGADIFYGVGPGAGLCVETDGAAGSIPNGMLILPVYTFINTNSQRAGFIYSADGVTWTRGNEATTGDNHGWSGENCLVQIDNTTVRHFYRDGYTTLWYTDHTWNGSGWTTGTPVDTKAIAVSGCELSAINYSTPINGKPAIIVSTPASGSGARTTGKIHVFLVNSDKTMTLYNTYSVVEDGVYYCYSSLSETKEGDIALLYEDGWTGDANGLGSTCFQIIPITTLVPTAKDPTGVTLTQSEITPNEDGSITLYTNATEAGGRKHAVQLTAAVLPSMADQTVTWTTSNGNVATVVNGRVTAVGNGTATITATSTKQGVFATLTVKVATRVESITVKKDGADIGSTPVKVYTNATDEGHSVTLTAVTTPAEEVTHPQLDWTRSDGAKGQLTLSDRGENGSSITITAVPGEKNVGAVQVEVASAEHPDVKTTFTVHVIRKLENNVSISIRGVNDPTKAPQFGQTLEADINDLQMTDKGKRALTYQWKRTKGGATTNIGTGAKTYTLTQEDIGAVISVEVTAGANSFYEGTRSATRALPVELADGPLTGPQNLTGAAPNGADATDGSISGFGDNYAIYEYRLMVTNGVENEWADVTTATIGNLAAGTYQVRAKETATHKAGGFSVVTVPAFGATTYAVNLDAAMEHGRVSRSASVAEEKTPVTLTVLPETGYRLTADGLSVEKGDDSAVSVTKVAGRENEYTFIMPNEAVTVKATFEQLMFTITHELTNLHCDRGAADGHQVAYGESAAVTLRPNEGYVLPLRKDITITNSRGDKITGWTISDDGVITITGGVTSDLNIVAVGRPDTHTVNYTLTNGLAKAAETATQVGHMAAYTGILEAEAGYTLPESIVVTVDGSLIGADNYLYNRETGEISISEGKITGNVVITAAGVKTGDETVPVTGVTLNRTEANVTVGGTLNLTATVAPANATNKTVAWATADDSIATVDENGKVTGVAEGTTTITVMTVDRRQTAECVVNVTEATSPSRPSGGSNTSSETTKTETRDDGSKVTTVTKPDGSKVETVEQPDGSKTEAVTAKDGSVTITATDPDGEELAKVEIPATIPEPEVKFDDIDKTPWAVDSINNVAGLALVKGTGGSKYDPIAPMTRGSLATVLHRLSQGKTDYENTFKDVAQGKYYTEGVAWAAKAKVVTGYSADIFAPDDIITREQLAVMLARYAKLIGMDTTADSKALDKFADGENTGAWAVDGVAWCVEQGILQGKGENDLDPTAKVTRAEVAVMLDRFIGLMK